jgi:hypothetical protein
MKLIILRLNSTIKPSPMSEGVTNIQINNQPYKGIYLTTQHTQPRRALRVAIIHDVTKMPGWVLPRPSDIFHVYTSADTRGWPEHYLIIHSWSEVRYRPTHQHRKLLSLGISYVPYVPVHFKCLFNRAQPTRALIDTGGAYHLGAPNIRSDHSSSFPSSILHFPLIAPPGLQLCQPFDHLAKPHRTSIDRIGPIASGFQPLVFYR